MRSIFGFLLFSQWAWLNYGMRPAMTMRVAELSQEECDAPVDLIFLLDGSWSVNDTTDWPALRKFSMETASRFVIGEDRVQVGVVQYASTARVDMKFTSTSAAVQQGLAALTKKGGNTNLTDGLIHADELFDEHAREARRILVIVSDGDVDYDANKKAREMEDQDGVFIFSVAVGEDADERELKQIATRPQLFFKVSQYGALEKIVKTISRDGCHIAEQIGKEAKVSEVDLTALLGKKENADVTESTEDEEEAEVESTNAFSVLHDDDKPQEQNIHEPIATPGESESQVFHTAREFPTVASNPEEVTSLRKRVAELENEVQELHEKEEHEPPCAGNESPAAGTPAAPTPEMYKDILRTEKDMVKNQKEMLENQESMKEELTKSSEESPAPPHRTPQVAPDTQEENTPPQPEAAPVPSQVASDNQDENTSPKLETSGTQDISSPSEPETPTAPEAANSASSNAFQGGELKDEETNAYTVQTEISGECFVSETAGKFMPVYEGWLLLASLSKRLLWEELARPLQTFRRQAQSLVPELANLGSDMAFAHSFGKHLEQAAEQVNFTNAQLLRAEYKEFQAQGLEKMKYQIARDPKKKKAYDKIEGGICEGMRRFLFDVRNVETGTPAVRKPFDLWHMWQESWGAVRVIVKITTQCRVDIPDGWDRKVFMSPQHQDKWKVCKGAISYPSDQFPSAVMACARSDEEDPNFFGRDRNRVIRYLGCGKNRVKTEPPVSDSIVKGCLANDKSEDVKNFLNSACAAGSISDNKCFLYGPFYGIYSHPVSDLFGYHDYEEKVECDAREARAIQAAFDATSTPEPPKKKKSTKKKTGGRKFSLLEEEAHEAEEELCTDPQVTAFKGQLNRAMADYIYGTDPPLTYSQSRAFVDGFTKFEPTSWDPAKMMWSLPQDRKLDPPLWEMLREAEAGEGIMMISYGYSGAGKTTTLIGDAGAPVGGARGIDGVLSLYLKENSNKIKDVHVRIFEVYGRISPEDGRMTPETGSGIWGYDLKKKAAQYLGSASDFVQMSANPDEEDEEGPRRGPLDMAKLQEALDNDVYTYSVKDNAAASMATGIAWHDEVKKQLTVIEDVRLEEDQFKAGGVPIAHIRGTVNNPKSSRGTLFVMTNIYYKNGKMSPVSTVDLAGSEDPAVMVSGFLRFINRPGFPECDQGKSPSDMMNMYLSSLASWDKMSGSLAYCFELRNVLIDCDKKKPEMGCVDVEMSNGNKEFIKPKLDMEEQWFRKDPKGETLPDALVFKIGKQEAVFSFEEIFKLRKAGPVPLLSKHRKETNPLGKDWEWAERMWSRCIPDDEGACIKDSPGVMDSIISGVTKAKDYTELSKKPSIDTEVPRKFTIVSGGKEHANYGKWKDKPEVEEWKNKRKWFFNGLRDILEQYEAKRENEQFDRHLRYFTGAIGPIVEEAFFINEALNNMKGYLGQWAGVSAKTPQGELFSLWPPEMDGEDQEVDYDLEGGIKDKGYNIFSFLKPKGAAESYRQELKRGEDNIMLVSMLEYIRGLGVRQEKNTKVLIGTFVRSDIPGADLDCDGAKASLEFAQDLSNMVGWSRDDPGVLPHYQQ